jgi:hypothetical protein
MGAFMRRDFAAIDRTMRPDVVIELPGSSWLAGTYRGYEEASRCILGLRRVLDAEEKGISFLHEGDQMIVRHDSTVHGPMHEVEMTLRVRIRYDSDGRWRPSPSSPTTSGSLTTCSTSCSGIRRVRRDPHPSASVGDLPDKGF